MSFECPIPLYLMFSRTFVLTQNTHHYLLVNGSDRCIYFGYNMRLSVNKSKGLVNALLLPIHCTFLWNWCHRRFVFPRAKQDPCLVTMLRVKEWLLPTISHECELLPNTLSTKLWTRTSTKVFFAWFSREKWMEHWISENLSHLINRFGTAGHTF